MVWTDEVVQQQYDGPISLVQETEGDQQALPVHEDRIARSRAATSPTALTYEVKLRSRASLSARETTI